MNTSAPRNVLRLALAAILIAGACGGGGTPKNETESCEKIVSLMAESEAAYDRSASAKDKADALVFRWKDIDAIPLTDPQAVQQRDRFRVTVDTAVAFAEYWGKLDAATAVEQAGLSVIMDREVRTAIGSAKSSLALRCSTAKAGAKPADDLIGTWWLDREDTLASFERSPAAGKPGAAEKLAMLRVSSGMLSLQADASALVALGPMGKTPRWERDGDDIVLVESMTERRTRCARSGDKFRCDDGGLELVFKR